MSGFLRLVHGNEAATNSAGLPRSGKKFWKMKKFPGQGKVREFQNFPKKMLVNRLLEISFSIICKQY